MYNFRLNIKENITKALTGVKVSLSKVFKSIDKVDSSLDDLEGSTKGVSRSFVSMAGRGDEVSSSMKRAGRSSTSLNRNFLVMSGSILGMNRQLGRLAGGFGAAFAIGGTVRAAVSSVTELENSQLRLRMLLGRNAQAAQTAYGKIEQFAVDAPFALADVNVGFQELLKQGLNPSMSELGKLGDLATFAGTDFNGFVDILRRTQELDYSALGEIGVSAQDMGDKVALSFGGQTQVIDANSEALRSYVFELANTSEVAGAMSEQSNTTGGQIDKLKDRFALFTTQLGKSMRPAIEWGIMGLTWITKKLEGFTGWVQENWSWLGAWVKVLGKVVLGLGAVWTAMKVFSAGQAIVMSITTAWGFLTNALKVAKIAQIAFNTVAKVSPLGWIGIAVGAIASLFGWFKDLGDWLSRTFKPLIDGIKKAFEPLIDMISWLVDTYDKIFMGGLNSKIAEAQKQLDAQRGTTQEDVDARRAALGEAATDAQGRTGRGMLGQRFQESGLAKKEEEESLFPKIGMGTGSEGLGSGVSQGLSSVSEQAAQKRSITINIDKLVETFIIQTEDVSTSPVEMEEVIINGLLGAVNDVNNA